MDDMQAYHLYVEPLHCVDQSILLVELSGNAPNAVESTSPVDLVDPPFDLSN